MGVLITTCISISRWLCNLAQCGGWGVGGYTMFLCDFRCPCVHKYTLIKHQVFWLRGGLIRWKCKQIVRYRTCTVPTVFIVHTRYCASPTHGDANAFMLTAKMSIWVQEIIFDLRPKEIPSSLALGHSVVHRIVSSSSKAPSRGLASSLATSCTSMMSPTRSWLWWSKACWEKSTTLGPRVSWQSRSWLESW